MFIDLTWLWSASPRGDLRRTARSEVMGFEFSMYCEGLGCWWVGECQIAMSSGPWLLTKPTFKCGVLSFLSVHKWKGSRAGSTVYFFFFYHVIHHKFKTSGYIWGKLYWYGILVAFSLSVVPLLYINILRWQRGQWLTSIWPNIAFIYS